MRFPPPRHAGVRARAALATGALLVATAVGMTPGSGTPAGAAERAKGSGPVNVLYAGSLVTLMQDKVGPAFHASTGYTLSGVSAGSEELASEIKGGTQQADVFISAAPGVNASLMGHKNGNWVSWYATFASSPLLLAYNAKSPFAKELRTRPWYDVVTRSGFSLGRTDPKVDPKGVLAIEALKRAARQHHDRALLHQLLSTTNVFPEETLVGRLQAGQLDAGFFYGVEAAAAGLPTVRLTGIELRGLYTITMVNRAPHRAAARAFVAFLLGPKGRAIMKNNGLEALTPPKLSGSRSRVPSNLAKMLR